ncbi:MAG TPA: hypothetical protein VH008_12380 [Pseudonocardia sp.]|nr:hypothetical protein [Pseudonocardia sp.]
MITKMRHILRTVPVAIAVVLSVAACGSPFKSGSSGAPTPTDTSNGAALSTGTGASNGTAGTTGSSGTGTTGTSGGSSFGSAGGAASGGSAVGGQGGTSSGGSAAAGSATPGQAGATGGFGNTDPSAGMTPDQVAAYCTGFPYDPEIVGDLAGHDDVQAWTDLRKNTPVQLTPNVDVMVSDYQAISTKKRVYAQLRDELVANFKPLKDFKDQICVAH